MIRSGSRQVEVLKGGLYLVFRPRAKDGRCRLVAARFGIWPSDVELRTIKDALQDAMDGLGNQIAYDLSAEWQKLGVKDEYAGYALYWRVGSSRDVITADTGTAQKMQLALRQRVERLKRQDLAARSRSLRAQTPRRTGVL
jgi:hypothetical protein